MLRKSPRISTVTETKAYESTDLSRLTTRKTKSDEKKRSSTLTCADVQNRDELTPEDKPEPASSGHIKSNLLTNVHRSPRKIQGSFPQLKANKEPTDRKESKAATFADPSISSKSSGNEKSNHLKSTRANVNRNHDQEGVDFNNRHAVVSKVKDSSDAKKNKDTVCVDVAESNCTDEAASSSNRRRSTRSTSVTSSPVIIPASGSPRTPRRSTRETVSCSASEDNGNQPVKEITRFTNSTKGDTITNSRTRRELNKLTDCWNKTYLQTEGNQETTGRRRRPSSNDTEIMASKDGHPNSSSPLPNSISCISDSASKAVQSTRSKADLQCRIKTSLQKTPPCSPTACASKISSSNHSEIPTTSECSSIVGASKISNSTGSESPTTSQCSPIAGPSTLSNSNRNENTEKSPRKLSRRNTPAKERRNDVPSPTILNDVVKNSPLKTRYEEASQLMMNVSHRSTSGLCDSELSDSTVDTESTTDRNRTDLSDDEAEYYIPRRKKLRSEVSHDELWEGIPLSICFKRLAPITKSKSPLAGCNTDTTDVKSETTTEIENGPVILKDFEKANISEKGNDIKYEASVKEEAYQTASSSKINKATDPSLKIILKRTKLKREDITTSVQNNKNEREKATQVVCSTSSNHDKTNDDGNNPKSLLYSRKRKFSDTSCSKRSSRLHERSVKRESVRLQAKESMRSSEDIEAYNSVQDKEKVSSKEVERHFDNTLKSIQSTFEIMKKQSSNESDESEYKRSAKESSFSSNDKGETSTQQESTTSLLETIIRGKPERSNCENKNDDSDDEVIFNMKDGSQVKYGIKRRHSEGRNDNSDKEDTNKSVEDKIVPTSNELNTDIRKDKKEQIFNVPHQSGCSPPVTPSKQKIRSNEIALDNLVQVSPKPFSPSLRRGTKLSDAVTKNPWRISPRVCISPMALTESASAKISSDPKPSTNKGKKYKTKREHNRFTKGEKTHTKQKEKTKGKEKEKKVCPLRIKLKKSNPKKGKIASRKSASITSSVTDLGATITVELTNKQDTSPAVNQVIADIDDNDSGQYLSEDPFMKPPKPNKKLKKTSKRKSQTSGTKQQRRSSLASTVTSKLRLNNERRCTEMASMLSNPVLNKHACVIWSSENRRHHQMSNPDASLTEIDETLRTRWEVLDEREKLKYFQRARNAIRDENRHSNQGHPRSSAAKSTSDLDVVESSSTDDKAPCMTAFCSMDSAGQLRELEKWLHFFHEVSPEEYTRCMENFKQSLSQQREQKVKSVQEVTSTQKTKPRTRKRKHANHVVKADDDDTHATYRRLLYEQIVQSAEMVVELFHEKRQIQKLLLQENYNRKIRKLISGKRVFFGGNTRSRKLTEVLYDIQTLEAERLLSISAENDMESPTKVKSLQRLTNELIQEAERCYNADPDLEVADPAPSERERASEFSRELNELEDILVETAEGSLPELDPTTVQQIISSASPPMTSDMTSYPNYYTGHPSFYPDMMHFPVVSRSPVQMITDMVVNRVHAAQCDVTSTFYGGPHVPSTSRALLRSSDVMQTFLDWQTQPPGNSHMAMRSMNANDNTNTNNSNNNNNNNSDSVVQSSRYLKNFRSFSKQAREIERSSMINSDVRASLMPFASALPFGAQAMYHQGITFPYN